jgi:hypothetical protein
VTSGCHLQLEFLLDLEIDLEIELEIDLEIDLEIVLARLDRKLRLLPRFNKINKICYC